MNNLRLAYDENDYIKMRIRVLYSAGNSFVVYDFDSQDEIEIQIGGIVGGYSCISGDEYDITVHKNSCMILKAKQEG